MKADLTDAELDELDALLQQAPQALEPLDVVSLDGYLCAVAVQPRIVPAEQWLARALDTDGSRWPPAGLDAAWQARVQALVTRRFEAIVRGLAEEGGFDPVVSEPMPAESAEAAPEAPPESPLLYWSSGFLYGCEVHGTLLDHPEDAVHLALARILRHLPPEGDEDRAVVAELDREHPLRDDRHAIDDTVQAAVDLWNLTARERLAVRTVQRETPKVGRNDPCPCGSGRKFKQCHGKS